MANFSFEGITIPAQVIEPESKDQVTEGNQPPDLADAEVAPPVPPGEVFLETVTADDETTFAEPPRLIGASAEMILKGMSARKLRLDNFTRVVDSSSVSDPLRMEGGRFYIYDDTREDAKFFYSTGHTEGLNSKFEIDSHEKAYAYGHGTVQKFTIRANPRLEFLTNGQFDSDKWVGYVNSFKGEERPLNVLGEEYTDTAYQISIPRDESVSGRNLPPNSRWANAEYEYLYYSPTYEKNVDKSETRETSLLSLYFFVYDSLGLSSSEDDFLSKYSKSIIKSGDQAKVKGLLEKNSKNTGNQAESFKSENLIFSFDAQTRLQGSIGGVFSFPMFGMVDFSTVPKLDIGRIVTDEGLDHCLLTTVVDTKLNGWHSTETFERYEETVADDVVDATVTEARVVPLLSLVDRMTESRTGKLAERSIFFKRPGEVNKINQILKTVVAGKLGQISKNYNRSIIDVWNGKKCVSEDILYCVEKHAVLVDGSVGSLLQTFWFPNIDGALAFRDTQVKYGRRYEYRFKSYNSVVTTNYRYQSIKPFDDGTAEIVAVTEPEIKLIETLLYRERVFLLDKPPAPPDVDIASYKGVNNKVLLRFSGLVGEVKQRPVFLEKEEDIEKFRQAQKVSLGQEITFENDDRNVSYNVYRLDQEPTSLNDFKGAKIASVDSEESTAYVDRIEPNKRYYYVCTARDEHGHISNPSLIHRVEMVDDGGAVYLVHDLFEIKPREKGRKSKPCKKYMQIIPTLPQSMLDMRGSGLLSAESAKGVSPKLGVMHTSVFGKRFKIRIRSRHTGKVIDINVDFTKETSDNT